MISQKRHLSGIRLPSVFELQGRARDGQCRYSGRLEA